MLEMKYERELPYIQFYFKHRTPIVLVLPTMLLCLCQLGRCSYFHAQQICVTENMFVLLALQS